MRNLTILGLSTLFTTSVIGYAYYQKKQFYPTVVYLTKSNTSLAFIYIQIFTIILLLGNLWTNILFGTLRPFEIDQLSARSWYVIIETCLAFTIFRDEFDVQFLVMLLILIFCKGLHWLANERVDYLERTPLITWIFHFRLILILFLLGTVDVFQICRSIEFTKINGASSQFIFGFEYIILFTHICNTFIKYIFRVKNSNESFSDFSTNFLLYIELILSFMRATFYILFILVMANLLTIPLFAFRPMLFSIRTFVKTVNVIISSRRAIRNMNNLYPDATEEELASVDNICIICREEMLSTGKKLPCSHIFHRKCLQSWFQRQQTCPTCRFDIFNRTTSLRINERRAEQTIENTNAPTISVQETNNNNQTENLSQMTISAKESIQMFTKATQTNDSERQNINETFQHSKSSASSLINRDRTSQNFTASNDPSQQLLYENINIEILRAHEQDLKTTIQQKIKHLCTMKIILNDTFIKMQQYCDKFNSSNIINQEQKVVQETTEYKEANCSTSNIDQQLVKTMTSEIVNDNLKDKCPNLIGNNDKTERHQEDMITLTDQQLIRQRRVEKFCNNK